MDEKEESIRQSRQYEAALACFSAAFQLQAQQQRVNSNSILEYLGKGSLSTTAKYARIWHELLDGKSPEVVSEVQRAYKAALRESDFTDISPCDPAQPIYIELVERVVQELKESLVSEGWSLTQRLVDQEIETICQDADRRITEALAAKEEAESDKDVAIAAYEDQEAGRETLLKRNASLQQEVSKLEGRLKGLEIQRCEWTKKSDSLGETVNEQSIQLVRITEQKLNLEKKVVDLLKQFKIDEQKILKLQELLEKSKTRVVELEKSDAISTARWETIQQQLIEVSQNRDVLEARIYEQSFLIATLTGKTRSAERANQEEEIG